MDTNTTTAAIGAASQPNLQTVVNFLCGNGMLLGRWFFDGPPAGERDRFWWRKYLRASFAASTVTASAEALEALKGRISRIGLDIDRALAGEVVEQSPVSGRLKQIAVLARAAAPAAQEAEPAPMPGIKAVREALERATTALKEEDCVAASLALTDVERWCDCAAAPRPQADAGAAFGRLPADVTPADAVRHAKRFGAREVPAYGNKDNPLLLYPADLARMLAAASQAPAAGAAPSLDDLTELVRSLGHSTRRQSVEIASAVLARWGAAAPAPDAPRLIGVDMAAGPDATAYWTAEPAPFQQRVQPWLMECFGSTIAGDREERNHRFLEETLELVQACGCSASEAHQLVNYVFGRPVGEPAQEVGGVMVTLAALCLANGLDMHAAGETELARIWTKVEAIRAKQAAKPKHSPLPEHTPTRAADSPQGAPIVWPKARDVGRIGDMSPSDSLRVGLDGDNDVYVSVCGGGGVGSVEFCTPGPGGGKSRRTRVALLALMVAMEADNADDSGRDWWARRMGGVTQEGGS